LKNNLKKEIEWHLRERNKIDKKLIKMEKDVNKYTFKYLKEKYKNSDEWVEESKKQILFNERIKCKKIIVSV